MSAEAVGVRATTLTPLAYHSLMVQSGTATLPELLADTAMAFGLASTLGMLAASVGLPARDYRGHLGAMPYRCAVFVTDAPRLLPPLVRRLSLDAEAGYPKKVQDVAKKGNLKEYFLTQEVPPGQVFRGAVFGLDPFRNTGEEALVIRVGLHRAGMVKLERDRSVDRVRLNAATAHLFGRELTVERYCLYNIQLTPWLPLAEAAEEVRQWS